MERKKSVGSLTVFLLLASCLLFGGNIEARGYRSTYKVSTKSYTPKAPYAGFGKRSRVNGMIKTKPISSHVKRTSNGYRRVNSYSRSK